MTETPNTDLTDLQDKLGIRFEDLSLLREALTHRSFAHEHEQDVPDNERLEFLGDAVVSIIAADLLYHHFPKRAEGWLTRLRAALVRTESLAELSSECGFGEALRMGKGEEMNGGRERETNLCAAFEAVLGGLYLDQGIDAVREFVIPMLEARLQFVMDEAAYEDARTVLQEWSQGEYGITPMYETIGESGPEHEKTYRAQVIIGEDIVGEGEGRSKRAAAQDAARVALKRLNVRADD